MLMSRTLFSDNFLRQNSQGVRWQTENRAASLSKETISIGVNHLAGMAELTRTCILFDGVLTQQVASHYLDWNWNFVLPADRASHIRQLERLL